MAHKEYAVISSELDRVIARLQESDVSVDEAVKLYEQGLGYVSQLEKRLQQAENTIEKLNVAIDTTQVDV